MRAIAAIVMMLLLIRPAWAAELSCPETISVAPQTMAKRIEGWRYFSDPDATHSLDTVAIYSGKKKLTRLSPGKGTESYEQWVLTDNGKEQYQLVCGYKRTSILLKRPLDSKLTVCKATFGQNKSHPGGPPVLHKIACE